MVAICASVEVVAETLESGALATPNMLGWEAVADSDSMPVNHFVVVEWPLEFARFVDGELTSRAPPGVSWVYDARGVRLLTGNRH